MADKKISQLTAASTPLAGTEVLPIVQSSATVKVSVENLTAGRAVTASSVTTTGNTQGAALLSIAASGTNGVSIGDYGSDAGTFRIAAISGRNLTFINDYAGLEDARFDASGNYKITRGNLIQGTAAKGVNFTANTPAAGMTSQLLNWYEEGTWTGGVSFGGAATGITYNNTLGYYTRIGNLVTVTAYIYLLNKGSSTGAARITGLPFTCANNGAAYSAPSLFFSNLTYLGQVSGYININDTTVDLYQTTEAGTASAITDTNFANNTAFILSLTYRAA